MNNSNDLLEKQNIRVAMTLVPNGLSKNKLKYGIGLGLECKDAEKDFPKITAELLKSIGQLIDEWIDKRMISVFIGDTTKPVAYELENDKNRAFGSQFDAWRSILRCPKKNNDGFKDILLQDIEQNDEILNKETQDWDFLKSIGIAAKNLSSEEEEAELLRVTEEIDNELNNAHEYAYKFQDKVSQSREIISKNRGQLSKAAMQSLTAMSDENVIDFNDILGAIYQHSALAEKVYGLLLNILVDIPVEISSKPDNKHQRTLYLAADNSIKDYIRPDQPQIDNKVDYKRLNDDSDLWIIREREDYEIVKHKNRYFHGRPNFGLVSLGPSKLKWLNNSELLELNTKLSSIQNEKATIPYFEKFINKNPLGSEGIIACHDLNKDEYTQLFEKEGLLGHSPAVIKKYGKNKQAEIKSLCTRVAGYAVSGYRDFSVIEEGVIKIDSVQESFDGDKKNWELFKWEGQNLCVPKVGKQDNAPKIDEPRNEEEARNIRQNFGGTEDPDLDDHIEKRGFRFQYGLSEGSNTMLSVQNSYSFVLREVEAFTNAVLPVDSKNSYEISLEYILSESDLLESIQDNHLILDYQNTKGGGVYTLEKENNPISGAVLLGPKRYENDKIQEADSDENITLKPDSGFNSDNRYFYPPQTSLQFVQQMGLLEPDRFRAINNSINKNQYFRKAYKLVQRSRNQIYSISRNGAIKYLSDPRGTHLYVVAGDWRTQLLMQEYRLDRRYIKAFLYNKDKEDPYSLCYPLKVSVSDTQEKLNIIENAVGDTEYNYLNILLPKNTSISLRAHLLDNNKADNCDFEDIKCLHSKYPFSTFKARNVSPKPISPSIDIEGTNKLDKFTTNRLESLYSGGIILPDIDIRRILDELNRLEIDPPRVPPTIPPWINGPGPYTIKSINRNHPDLPATIRDVLISNELHELEKENAESTIVPGENLSAEELLVMRNEPITSHRFASEQLKTFSFLPLLINIDKSLKKISLVSESEEIIDDGISLPTQQFLDNYDNERYHNYLKNEYPADIFKTKVGDIATNIQDCIYPNLFGVSFDIPRKALDLTDKTGGTYIVRDEVILELSINENNKVSIKRLGDSNKFELYLVNEIKNYRKVIAQTELRDQSNLTGAFLFHYGLTVEFDRLHLFLHYRFGLQLDRLDLQPDRYALGDPERGFNSFKEELFNIVGLPDPSLGEERLSLSKNVEEMLLYYDYPFNLRFNMFKSSTSSHFEPSTNKGVYFIYRDEGDVKHKLIKSKLIAVSKYESHFPEKESVNDLRSESKDTYTIKNLGNDFPLKPNLVLTTLFHRDEDKKWEKEPDKDHYKRASQNYRLMLELDRSWSEDYLALVISEKGRVTDGTCAIGKDITKHFGSAYSKKSLINYLNLREKRNGEEPDRPVDERELTYTEKYLLSDNKTIEVTKDGVKYTLLLLKPTFHREKNKWIAILGFKDGTVDGDPFVRIVTTRCQPDSSKEKYKISDFTMPQHIPILSSRSVRIEKHTKQTREYRISITRNNHTVSADDNIYIACLISKDKNGIYYPDALSETRRNIINYKLIKDPAYFVMPYKKSDFIVISEIQKYDNMDLATLETEIDRQQIDIFNDPRLKIIYMQEFTAK